MKPYIHPQALVETANIGLGTRIWAFAHVMAGAGIGSDCNIGDHAFIETGTKVGNGVTIKNNVLIWKVLHVADYVFIDPNVVFTNDRRDPVPAVWEFLQMLTPERPLLAQ